MSSSGIIAKIIIIWLSGKESEIIIASKLQIIFKFFFLYQWSEQEIKNEFSEFNLILKNHSGLEYHAKQIAKKEEIKIFFVKDMNLYLGFIIRKHKYRFKLSK